jgi:hypothetical protein
MEIRLKRLAMLFLTTAVLVVLATSAFGAFSAEKAPAEKKGKNLKQTVGKNWEIQAEGVKQKGKPEPIKSLIDTANPERDEPIIEERVDAANKNLDPVSEQQ